MKNRSFYSYTLWFALMITSCMSHAQIVNIEKARKITDTIGFAGGGELRGSYLENEETFLDISVIPDVQYKTEKDLWLLIGAYSLTKSDDVDFRNSGMVHLRYNRKMNQKLRLEAFSQIQKDKVNNLEYRYLIGGGPRYKLRDGEKLKLYAGFLPMLELEKTTEPNFDFGRFYRASNYMSFTYDIQEYATLFSTTYYQPEWNDFSDYRFYNENLLSVDLGKFMAFEFASTFSWDNEPPVDAPNKLLKFSGGLSLHSK